MHINQTNPIEQLHVKRARTYFTVFACGTGNKTSFFLAYFGKRFVSPKLLNLNYSLLDIGVDSVLRGFMAVEKPESNRDCDQQK